jgi:adenylate cyclase
MTGNTVDSRASRDGGLFRGLKSRPDFKAIAFVLAIAGSFLLLTTLLHMPHGPEHWSADLRTKYLSTRLPSQHDRIALVYVSESTMEPYAYLSPIDRVLLANLVRAVDAAEPAVIGFDFIIDRPTEPAKDEALIAALRDAKSKVIVGAVDEPKVKAEGGQSYQAAYLAEVNRPVGHLHFDSKTSKLTISDHVIRQMADPRDHHEHPTSFARRLVDTVGSYPEPKSTYISWLLKPWDGSQTFQSLPADAALGRSGPPLPLKEMLKGKIVLIGGHFQDRDQHLLPLSVVSDQRYPGLFVHAQIVAQLLDQRSLSTLGLPLQLIVLALAAALGVWTGRRQRQIHLVAELLSVIGLVMLGILAFVYGNLILPYTGLLLTWLSGLAVGHYTRPGHA